jgi:hypothetical protein
MYKTFTQDIHGAINMYLSGLNCTQNNIKPALRPLLEVVWSLVGSDQNGWLPRQAYLCFIYSPKIRFTFQRYGLNAFEVYVDQH